MSRKAAITEKPATETNFSLKDYLGKEVFEKSVELYDYLRLPLFRKKDTGIVNRYFNWWAKENVLPENQNKAGRLTFVEFVWVKMIEQLKAFGVPLPIMAKVREGLFKNVEIKGLPDKKEQFKEYLKKLEINKEEKSELLKLLDNEGHKNNVDTGVTVLELLLLRCILKRKALGIGVFEDGAYIIIDRENENKYAKENLELLNNSHYVQISISKILSEYLQTELAIQTIPNLKLLSYPENKLYEAIKTGDYESITVRFKDKKIKVLELKKSANVRRKIIDVLSEGDFAEIVVKKHNGEISKIEQSIKINF